LTTPADEAELEEAGGELDPDFTDQRSLHDSNEASGAGGSGAEDRASSGDAVYVPPIDPVIKTDAHGRAEILGGFGTESDADGGPEKSSDGRPGDEALADAVRRRLAEDSATTDLNIVVAVRNGVAHLRGRVADLDDADNAEAVAASVPGIREVVEELEVANV
jgi:hypothetical protein